MNKIKLFIDHDGTLTYCSKIFGVWMYKDGLQEFLNFAMENFEVYWCSGCEHIEILSNLRNIGITDGTLENIKYFDLNPSYEKTKSILGITKEFIFIDDDSLDVEYEFIRKKGLQDSFIKAHSKEKRDLLRIMKILKEKIHQGNKISTS